VPGGGEGGEEKRGGKGDVTGHAPTVEEGEGKSKPHKRGRNGVNNEGRQKKKKLQKEQKKIILNP